MFRDVYRLSMVAVMAAALSTTTSYGAYIVDISDIEVPQGGATGYVSFTITSDSPVTDLPFSGFNFPLQTTSSLGVDNSDAAGSLDGDDLPATLSYAGFQSEVFGLGNTTTLGPPVTPPFDALENYDRTINGGGTTLPGDEIPFTVLAPEVTIVEMGFAVDPTAPAGTVYDIVITRAGLAANVYNLSGIDATGAIVGLDAELTAGSITIVPEPNAAVLFGVSILGLGLIFRRRNR